MKKQLLLILATLLPLLAKAEKVEIDSIWYNLVSKAKQAEVTYKGDSYDSYAGEYSGSITIPSTVTYDGVTYSVTSIGSSAFNNCSSLTSVILPEGVTTIEDAAFFGCESLTSITIPESVTSIEDEAFSGCSSLTAVHISNLKAWCQISFGYYVSNPLLHAHNLYLNGELITELVIPDGVTSIKNHAFSSCESLTNITIPEGVTSIGSNAFSVCSSLTSITIPESVTSIGEYAFNSCRSLTSITIPEGVTSIEEYAFYGCSGLTSITIPENSQLTSIGIYAFYCCESLTAVHISSIKAWCKISFGNPESNPLYYTHNLYLNGELITELIIPENVTSIGKYAFFYCKDLESVTLSEGVMRIGEQAFTDCSSLTAIVLPKSITYIGSKAFANCTELTDVHCYAESVPKTGADAFDGSYPEYIKLHVPASALEAYKATAPWSSFGNIIAMGTSEGDTSDDNTSEGETPEDGTPEGETPEGGASGNETPDSGILVGGITLSLSTDTLTVGEELVLMATITPNDATSKDIAWSSSDAGVASVDSTGKVTAIAPGAATITAAASDSSGVSASCEVVVVVPQQQQSYTITFVVDGEVVASDTIVYGAPIVVPETPTKEGYTFSGWSEVPEVMPAHDVTITGTFAVNKYIVTFVVDGEVIAADAIEYGAPIVVPETPTKEDYTFSGWSEVPEMMPAHDVTITGTFVENENPEPEDEAIASGTCGDNLIWRLTKKYELVIEGAGDMYDYTANSMPWHKYLKEIKEIYIGEGTTSIGEYAFANCNKLTTITIPESVTSIGYRAIYRCNKLVTASLTEESQLTNIGYAAFEGCSRLTDITIPKGVKSIGEYAFFSCRKLASITCYAAIPPTIGGASTFSSVDKSIPVYVPEWHIEDYKEAKHWKEFTYFIGMMIADIDQPEVETLPSTLNPQPSTIIYDLQGHRITNTEGLRGIYIVNGKKVFVK